MLNKNFMYLKLIKTRPFITGCHCELLEINHVTGNRHLGDVFVLNEHLPLELIYPLSITHRGIYLQGRHCGWVWDFPKMEKAVNDYLAFVQSTHEEIRVEVCQPEPELPGYPYTDYHPDDYPIVLGIDD